MLSVEYLAMGPSTLQCMSCQGSLGPTSGGVDLALEFLAGRQSKEAGQEAARSLARRLHLKSPRWSVFRVEKRLCSGLS